MNVLRCVRIFSLITVALTSLVTFKEVKASTFDETEIDQSQVIAIARPYGDHKYDLLVIQQIPDKQACWSESGTAPVVVDPLLLNFDFTGICQRATDSNGYSIRINGQDYGLDYILRLVERDGELILVGSNRVNPTQQEIVVGRTKGLSQGLLKIHLEAGWKFTRRTYNNKVLGHFYFSNNLQETDTSNVPETSSSVEPTSSNGSL